jgi:hypothetical protein
LDYYIPGDKCHLQAGLFYCQIYGKGESKHFYRLQLEHGVSKSQCKLIILAYMLMQKVQEKQSDT